MRLLTKDHARIVEWARSSDATPVEVHTRAFDGEPARLRFVFGQMGQELREELKAISWDQFFALFDALGLAMELGQGRHYELVQTDEWSRSTPPRCDKHDGEGRLKPGSAAAAEHDEPQEGE